MKDANNRKGVPIDAIENEVSWSAHTRGRCSISATGEMVATKPINTSFIQCAAPRSQGIRDKVFDCLRNQQLVAKHGIFAELADSPSEYVVQVLPSTL